MTVSEANLTEKQTSFSHNIERGAKGHAVKIKLFGLKNDWEPKLRKLFNEKYSNHKDILEVILARLGDLKEITTIEIPFSKVEEPKNVITSISEIPSVVKGTSLPVFRLTKKVNGTNREVIMLGETHIATSMEAKAVSRIMPYFTNFGCEGIDVNDFIEGKFFFWFMNKIAYPFNYILSFRKRSKKNKNSLSLAEDYAMDIRAEKRIISLEKGWRPSFRLRSFFVLFPLYFLWSMFSIGSSSVVIGSEQGWQWAIAYIGGTVLFWLSLLYIPVIKHVASFTINLIFDYVFDVAPSRNRNMSKNLLTTLERDNSINIILVLTGRAHVKPMIKILKNKYGFVEKDFN